MALQAIIHEDGFDLAGITDFGRLGRVNFAQLDFHHLAVRFLRMARAGSTNQPEQSYSDHPRADREVSNPTVSVGHHVLALLD